ANNCRDQSRMACFTIASALSFPSSARSARSTGTSTCAWMRVLSRSDIPGATRWSSITLIGSPPRKSQARSREPPESTRPAQRGSRKTQDGPRGVGVLEPCAQAFDLRTAGGAFGADDKVAGTGSALEALAAITRLMLEAAIDQHVDLALDEL